MAGHGEELVLMPGYLVVGLGESSFLAERAGIQGAPHVERITVEPEADEDMQHFQEINPEYRVVHEGEDPRKVPVRSWGPVVVPVNAAPCDMTGRYHWVQTGEDPEDIQELKGRFFPQEMVEALKDDPMPIEVTDEAVHDYDRNRRLARDLLMIR